MRFQHGSGGDPEGFRARCALLAEDLADVPAELLRVAVAAWVREQPFLPTASDLTRLMREELERRDRAAAPSPEPPRTERDVAQAFCDSRNAHLLDHPRDHYADIEWIVDATGEPKLRYKPDDEQLLWKRERIRPETVTRINAALRRQGSSQRWTADGHPFDLMPGDDDPAPAEYPWGSGDQRRP